MFFVRLALALFAFFVAKHTATESKGPAWKTYASGVWVALFFAVIFAFIAGQPSQDIDGNLAEGYEVMVKARVEHGLLMFTILLIPALVGVNRGLPARRRP